MSRVPGATDLRGLSIPGTHESCARFKAGSAGFAQCQNQDLHWQLRAGVRYLDIRCRVYGDIFTIHHGPYYQGMVFGEVLKTCRDFLAAYPTETILMRMQQEYSDDTAAYKRIFAEYLDVKGWRSLFHLDRSFPTLGEARGKIVLMSGWPYLDQGLRFSDESLFSVQDDYADPQPGRKQRLVDEQLRASFWNFHGRKIYVNHLSATGAGSSVWTPWKYAARLNPWTRKLLEGDYFYKTHRTGIVAMDYVDSPDGNWNAGDIDMTACVIRFNTLTRPVLAPGKSYVVWNQATGKALDGGTAQTSVVQWTYTGLPQQRWTLEAGYAPGIYRLRCERSGKYLTCRAGAGATQENTTHHYWQIAPAGDSGFTLRQDYVGSDLRMQDGTKESGKQPTLGGSSSHDDSHWIFDERVQVR